MKVTYLLNTLWPKGMPNPGRYDAIDWERVGEIPFVPTIGLLIDCGDGDFRKVDDVYWSADAPGEITVSFEDDDRTLPATLWMERGWIVMAPKAAAHA